jgi:Ca2+-binding EF-hand superfamily protein
MLSILHKNAEQESRFQFLFKVFDCDEDGLVSKSDLQTIIYKLYGFAAEGKKGKDVTKSAGVQREDLKEKMDEYIQHLFDAYDTDGDNRVTDREFEAMFEDELVQKAYTLCSVDFT